MLTRVTLQTAIVRDQYLYERRISLPSTWNPDHRRFYMTATPLIGEEDALEPIRYRIQHLQTMISATIAQSHPTAARAVVMKSG
jgi:hypothetical protein